MIEKLIGKTIKTATQLRLKDLRDRGYLLLEFTDGTKAIIISDYSHWEGPEVFDEYPTFFNIKWNDEVDLSQYVPYNKEEEKNEDHSRR